MRLASFADGRLGVVEDGRLADVTRVVPASGWSPMRTLATDAGRLLPAVAAEAARLAEAGETAALDDIALGPPVPDPSKIVAAPVNYVDHRVEMHELFDIAHLGIFLKAPSSVTGHHATVRLPYVDRRFDQEGELAVIVGARMRHVPVEKALLHLLGYTGALDITMRGGEDRSTRKSFDTFTPLGPWIVTPDEAGAPGALELTCEVNGQLRQKVNTSELIWGVAELLSYVSSVMTLLPGDVVLTGTPAGVGPLADGDAVTVSIDTIGSLSVSVSSEGAVPCPTLGASSGPVPPPPPGPVGSG